MPCRVPPHAIHHIPENVASLHVAGPLFNAQQRRSGPALESANGSFRHFPEARRFSVEIPRMPAASSMLGLGAQWSARPQVRLVISCRSRFRSGAARRPGKIFPGRLIPGSRWRGRIVIFLGIFLGSIQFDGAYRKQPWPMRPRTRACPCRTVSLDHAGTH